MIRFSYQQLYYNNVSLVLRLIILALILLHTTHYDDEVLYGRTETLAELIDAVELNKICL